MRNIEGLYSAIRALINEKEEKDRLVIDANNLIRDVKKEVDVYSASLDWYINFALRAAVETGLNQAGYRSAIKGEGFFVSEKCSKPEYCARLFNNAKLSEAQKAKVVSMLKKNIDRNIIPGQLTIDFSTGMIIEDVTEKQLLEILRKDAEEDAN